jgi:phospholipid/cholesterol/gamma-HCH transport system substrate-binding protein
MIISATLKDASPLLNGNDVRLKGVRVGKIADISIVNGGARLMLELDASALPVYKNATVTSRPVSLLGERYVDLDPGTPSSGVMADGGTIVGGNAKSSTDLDQVLNTLDQPTSKDLAALVTALGTGLDGNGKNTDDAIKALLPAMTDTDKLMKVLKAQNKTLGSLVDSLEPVASGLSVDESKSLDKLVGSTRDVLQTTAINEKAFRQLMAQLPATMSSARRTLEQLQGTSDAAVPVLDRLRPTTDNLMQISRELLAFADATDPALRSANPVLRKAEKLIVAATPVAEELRKQGPAMKSSVTSLDSLTAKLAPNFTSVMEFLRGWALATNGKDGLGHYFRAGLVVDPAGVTGLIPGLPTPDQTPAGNSPDTTQGAPISGSSAEDAPASKLENLLSGLLSPKTSTDGGVTGLTAHQEQGALAFLLGGN